LVGVLGGELLNASLAYYRHLFIGLAIVTLLMGYFMLRMPCAVCEEEPAPNPLTAFLVIRDNPMFGYVLLAWFLFGAANLALAPQRIEYLSQAKYGLNFDPRMIVLIVAVTTEAVRLCVIPIWARLFDHFNFLWLRIAMCSFILLHMLLYYQSRSLPMLMLSSACLGMAYGGGAIAWTLWVTKFAPPEQTARYMSIHTFLTGVRGFLAPFAGYWCVRHLGIHTTAWLAAGFVFLAITIFWIIRNRSTRPQ
jgi:predicted MFS family arabinose efflux permease